MVLVPEWVVVRTHPPLAHRTRKGWATRPSTIPLVFVGTRYFAEDGADLAITYCLLCEGESAVLFHFAGGAKKSSKCGARERAADAYALDSHR